VLPSNNLSILLTAGHWTNCPAVRTILPAWILQIEAQFKIKVQKGLLLQVLLPKALINNCIAKWRLGACDIQELPLLAASS